MTPVLELVAISKRFPGVRALHEVDFALAKGEIHALMGENGAGKSTMIKILAGAHQPDGGEIRVDGAAKRLADPRAAQRAGIATIHQELLLFPDLTVAENIFLGHAPKRRFFGLDWRATRRRAAEILAELDIDDLDVDETVGALSVGDRQRIEIAKALSLDARVLIMDEPTAALGEKDVERLFAIVRKLKARGVAVIYISHRLEEVFELADRVTVLRDGERVGSKAIAETDQGDLVQMMVGRRVEQLFARSAHVIGAPVLELRGASRAPRTLDVDLTVRAGEIVGLAGLVGAGRSELAQAIFGLTPFRSGTTRIEGETVAIDSPAAAKALGVAYVPEDRGKQGLARPMAIDANASLAALDRVSKRGFVDRGAERAMAERAIAEFDVKATGVSQIVGKLSGGNQQKVVISKWLATEPKLLILDEPTRGVDIGAKVEIHKLMNELAAKGLAILMISSELPEVLGMSDRIAVMRGGRIVAEFPRGARQEDVASAMMSDRSDAA